MLNWNIWIASYSRNSNGSEQLADPISDIFLCYDLHSDLCPFLAGAGLFPPVFFLTFLVLLSLCLQLSINGSGFVNS